jgi:hypothetical protein
MTRAYKAYVFGWGKSQRNVCYIGPATMSQFCKVESSSQTRKQGIVSRPAGNSKNNRNWFTLRRTFTEAVIERPGACFQTKLAVTWPAIQLVWVRMLDLVTKAFFYLALAALNFRPAMRVIQFVRRGKPCVSGGKRGTVSR